MNKLIHVGTYRNNAKQFINRVPIDESKLTKVEILRRYRCLRTNYLNKLLEEASLKRRIALLENKCIPKYNRVK